MPNATQVYYDDPVSFFAVVSVYDMQQEHATFCELPAAEFTDEDGWYYWWGDRGGPTERDFDIQNMISSGR